MLDVGFSEILLTSAIALIVLGPERLPKVARQVGNWMGRARAMARQLSEQLEREVNADELLKLQNKPTGGTASNNASAFDTSAYTSVAAPTNVVVSTSMDSTVAALEAAPAEAALPEAGGNPEEAAPHAAATYTAPPSPAAAHAASSQVAAPYPAASQAEASQLAASESAGLAGLPPHTEPSPPARDPILGADAASTTAAAMHAADPPATDSHSSAAGYKLPNE